MLAMQPIDGDIPQLTTTPAVHSRLEAAATASHPGAPHWVPLLQQHSIQHMAEPGSCVMTAFAVAPLAALPAAGLGQPPYPGR
jgi:hypothetical protein